MQQLQTTQAASVWSYFLKICAIPHPSRHERTLVEWIFSWAKEHNISCKQDNIGNLILVKPASAGYEAKTPVILQAHLDMVPQKNSDKVHDFTTDPIIPIIDGEWMHADNTTLGADNGVGMSSCLAVLASDQIAHGPLEVLLTAGEEIGMVGAFGLAPNLFEGKILINTDSEQEGDLYIGCAGGIRLYTDIPYQEVAVKSEHVSYEVALKGLKGGHSGCDIDLLRGNAITLLASALVDCTDIPYDLCSMEGGSLRNAIPREAQAIITCAIQDHDRLNQLISRLNISLQKKFAGIEDSMQLSLSACSLPKAALSLKSKSDLLNALKDCPNGIFEMDPNLDSVVQTSSNLGVLTQTTGDNSVFTMEMLVRSQVDAEKQHYVEKIFEYFQQYGGIGRREGDYPGWKPNTDSAIYRLVKKQYQVLFGHSPQTMVIHAGLECGLFSSKYPNWDMISFGPTIKFPHSPDEKVHIPSVDKYWKLLIATLEAIE